MVSLVSEVQYISEAEMWKYLNEGAVKASSLGKDWNDYTVSFLMGRAIYGFGTEDIIDDCKALYHRESDTDVYSKYSFKSLFKADRDLCAKVSH